MDTAIKVYNYRSYEISIYADDCPENPIKEWEILGKYSCWHKKYDLGNCSDFAAPEEVREYAAKTQSMLFPLFMYEHSGICLSLSNSHYPFNDRWDAGQLGYVLVDRQEALEKLGKKRLSKKLRERIAEIIEAEVETYNSYLSGEIYGYVIEKDGKQVDSCWGYYGLDTVEEEARSIVDNDISNIIKKHCKKVKGWIRNCVPLIYRFSPVIVG